HGVGGNAGDGLDLSVEKIAQTDRILVDDEETFRNRLGEDQDIHFLPKPFSLAQLAGKVKEVMDRVPA
ncbi:MAG: hypothetical protein HOG93_07725, partial [Rhodospirillaceae bacterium]|nr:hypothetical protein [Rhodospirillaceae bacterium]